MMNSELLPLGTIIQFTTVQTDFDEEGGYATVGPGDLGVIENYWVNAYGAGFDPGNPAVSFPYLVMPYHTAVLFTVGRNDFEVL
jgi:hypothetical protein